MTAKKRWLYIPVEIKVRAYHARLLLGCAAAEAGYGVVLGSQRELLEAIPYLGPGIFFDKSIAANKGKILSQIKSYGHQVAGIDEEGFVYTDPDLWAHQRLSEKTLDTASSVMTWGQAQHDIFARHYPNHMSKVHLTGNPRIDLLRPELREFYRNEADAISKEHGQFIFVPSNFSSYINANGPDFMRELYENYGHTATDDKRRELQSLIQFTARLFFNMLLAIDRLSMQFPDNRIVIRPHPGDDHQLWKNLMACYPNVVVEFKGTIEPYLLAADVILHNGCTSAIQAVLMDRLVLAYQPEKDDRYDQKLPNSISESIPNLDALEEQVRMQLNKSEQDSISQATREILDHHLASLQGEFAYQKIIGLLDQINIQEHAFDHARVRNWLILLPRRSARGLLTKFPGKFKAAEKYERQKFPGLELDEVQQDLQKLQSVTGRLNSVAAKQMSHNLFKIECDGRR
ncbi:MAG: surface carbohydrate biosynthesis protein [Phycisphaeraceae bacterium JB051]